MPQIAVFQQLNLMQYPELVVAFVLGIFMLFKNNGGARSLSDLNFPAWLTNPCVTILSRLPESYLKWLQKIQLWAGWRNNTAFGALAAIKICSTLLAVLIGGLINIWVQITLSVLGFFFIDGIIFLLANKRRKEIKEGLPQTLDLMVLCVDAGLGLDATISRIAHEESSVNKALNSEMAILGRDILLGMDREKAYQDLYTRTGVDELKSLGASLNQAQQLGIGISKILRAQSDFLRTKLSQKAEERAAKLPIYMAFPLWFCIMPALMVIVLAPSFINFFEYVKPLMFK